MSNTTYVIVEYTRTMQLASVPMQSEGLCAYGANALGENVEAIYVADCPATSRETLEAQDDVEEYYEVTEAGYQGWLADRAHRGLTTEMSVASPSEKSHI